jgi:hypothetical protein
MRNKLVWFSLIIGVVVGLFMAPTAALAWTDIDNATWMSQYQVTQAQVEAVADGFPDDSFRPAATVTRGQFAKMVVSGLDIAIANPVDATFTDVPRGHIFYQYVEGGVAAGLIQGLNSTQLDRVRTSHDSRLPQSWPGTCLRWNLMYAATSWARAALTMALSQPGMRLRAQMHFRFSTTRAVSPWHTDRVSPI